MVIVCVVLFGLKDRIIESKIAFSLINILLPTQTPKGSIIVRKRKTLIDTVPNARVIIMRDYK